MRRALAFHASALCVLLASPMSGCSSSTLPVGLGAPPGTADAGDAGSTANNPVCHTDPDCASSSPDECNVCSAPLNHLVCTSGGACACACSVGDAGGTDAKDAATTDGAVCHVDADCASSVDTCNICMAPLNHLVCTGAGTCACACTVSGSGDGGVGCSPPCGPGQVCVSNQTVGGGEPFPDDAGNCPPGTVHAGDRCAPPPTYSCAPTPSACTSGLDCTCAASLCANPSGCVSTSPGQVNCQFGAP
jgi:hypothetical protein